MKEKMENSMGRKSTFGPSFTRSFLEKSFTDKRSTPKDLRLSVKNKRLSIQDEKLLKVFLSKPDQPLGNNENWTGNEPNVNYTDENTPPTNGYGIRKSIATKNCLHLEKGCTPESSDMSSSPKTPTNIDDHDGNNHKENPFYARLQRDLNSPSAAARIRALNALKNPAKSGYNNFDIPHEEQDIITEEERTSPVWPKSIQEVMKDVVVYVEVRTGEDNRSAGVKKVISLLGANVNDRFLRNTTHVIFKDGLQSTYNKAKKWNIPIVSILWIEACKKHMRLMNPKLFPISNAERYENPELYTKYRRQRSMQPNAETSNRRTKIKTNKETDVVKTVKISSALRIPRKPKDKLDEIFSEFHEKLLSTPDDIDDCMPFESKLLQRIKNSPFTTRTPKTTEIAANTETGNTLQNEDYSSGHTDDDDFDEMPLNKSININAKKQLNFNNLNNVSSKQQQQRAGNQSKHNKTPNRRRTIHNSIKKLNEKSNITNNGNSLIQERKTYRKSLFNATTSKEKEDVNNLTKLPTKIPSSKNRRTICVSHVMSRIEENTEAEGKTKTIIANESMDVTMNNPGKPSKEQNRNRYTTNISQSIEEEPIVEVSCTAKISSRSSKARVSGLIKSNLKHKIIFDNPAPQKEISTTDEYVNNNIGSDNLKDNPKEKELPTELLNKTPQTLIEQHANSVIFNSAKTPKSQKRRTLFDISMDIISQRLQTINESARKSKIENSGIEPLDITTPPISTKNPDGKVVNQANTNLNKSSINDEISARTVVETDINDGCVNKKSETGIPKKRKLFAPIDMTPPPVLSQKSLNSSKSTTKKRSHPRDEFVTATEKKKRRTLYHPLTPNVLGTAEKKNSRRSSVDFQMASQKVVKTSTAINNEGTPKMPYLVYTNMHSDQIDVIKNVVNKLGRFEIEDNVSNNTTHVITLEPRRTMNILRGIVRGLWILNYDWILDSERNGKWLLEEQYEVRNFSRAIEICRSERQAFGPNYKIDLFSDCGPMYIFKNCSCIPAKYIIELVKLSAGRVVESKEKAKLIIGEYCDKYPDKICLQPQWILDSITNIQLKKKHKYIIKPETDDE